MRHSLRKLAVLLFEGAAILMILGALVFLASGRDYAGLECVICLVGAVVSVIIVRSI